MSDRLSATLAAPAPRAEGSPGEDRSIRRVFRETVLPLYRGLDPEASGQIEESIDRLLYYCRLADLDGVARAGGRILDLGPGLTPFGPLLRALGGRVTLVDDFGGGGCVDRRDPGPTQAVLERVRGALGLEIVTQDLLASPLPADEGSVDAVTSFHCFEHFHHSPRGLMSEVARVLKPGGLFVVGTPNAVNLRKRLSVLLGRTNLGRLEEWYFEGSPFRGHVREPVVGDLVRLCAWNGLRVVRIAGANFLGHHSGSFARVPAPLRPIASLVMRRVLPLWPGLCSDIHVVAIKPPGGRDH
jgi:SAM-dependent methyltransferase